MPLLHEWVARQAANRPRATALVFRGRRTTYAELEGASNRVARLLRQLGCAAGDRVYVLFPKSPEAVVTILGALKADCCYVPLDPASPATRLAKMLERCDSPWLVAGGPVARLVDELDGLASDRGLEVGWLGHDDPRPRTARVAFTQDDVAREAATPISSSAAPDAAAYILFTSGSTGVPKGVVITHRNVRHFIEWAVDYFKIGPDDRLSAHPPLHFDLSVFDMFGAFAAGAALHLVPGELNLLAPKLAKFIRDSRLTQWFSVPSVLNYLVKFNVVRPGDFPTLKRLLWCGEVLPTPTLIELMRRLPHVTFTNLYGPTETTIASSYYTVPSVPEDPLAPIPIGRPCAGEELLVLDERLEPVPAGEVGHLCIAGGGLSPGYWRDPERTREAFVTDPRSGGRMYRTGDLAKVGEEGLVYFLGRSDAQIKSRGYRIELGEIEAALHAMVELEEAAVVAIPTEGFEGWTICCAYVTTADGLSPAAIRTALAKHLPGYMLPGSWLRVERLPKNANGKVDRPALKQWFAAQAAPTATAQSGP